MKSTYFALPVLALATLMANADEVPTTEVGISEVAYGSYNTNARKRNDQTVKKVPHFHEYHNRISVFMPYHQTYERIRTDAFYVGIEGWIAPVLSNKGGTGHNKNLAMEAELRMGYNFFYNGRDHLTPFAGFGAFRDLKEEHWFRGLNRHTKSAILYGTLGFLYDHEFTNFFNLGFNLKGMLGGPVSQKHHSWGTPVVGFDFAVPFTFRFGHKRHWDLRIEPFDIYLHGQHFSRNYFGGRSTIGYRF